MTIYETLLITVITMTCTLFIGPFIKANIDRNIDKLNAKVSTVTVSLIKAVPYLVLLLVPLASIYYYLNSNPPFNKAFIITMGLQFMFQAVSISLAIVFFISDKYTKALRDITRVNTKHAELTATLTESFKSHVEDTSKFLTAIEKLIKDKTKNPD